MPSSNVNLKLTIQLENGQYKAAVTDVINSTKKMEKQAEKSFLRMDSAGDAFNKRMRKYVSFGALFGTAFGVAYSLVSTFFSNVSKGINEAIKNNSVLSSRLTKLKDDFDFLFFSIGNSLLPIVDAITGLLEKINISGLIQNSRKNRLKELKEERDMFKDQIKILEESISKGGIFVAADKKTLDNIKSKLKNNEKLTKTINEQIATEEKYKNKLKAGKEKVEDYNKAVEEFNKSISNLTNTMGGLLGADTTTIKMLNDIKGIGAEMENINKQIEIAKKNGQDIKINTGTILDILIVAYAVLTSIATSIYKAFTAESETERTLKKINKENEKYEKYIKGITNQIELLNIALNKQEIIPNDTIEKIEEEIKIIEELIATENKLNKTRQESIDDYSRYNIKQLWEQKEFFEMWNEMNKQELEYYKTNPIGMLANILGFGLPIVTTENKIRETQARLDIINDSINKYEAIDDLQKEIGKSEVTIIQSNIKLNELIKERNNLLAKQSLETADIEERLLNAQIEGSIGFQQKNNYIDNLIENVKKQIEAYKDMLEVAETNNEKLTLQADIQEHLNQMAELRQRKEEEITEQISKQVDLLKKYIDLGIDLENIRTIKQITKGYAKTGLTGVDLGSALLETGIKQSAISGKTLNIFGDINNTLNQATPNILISDLNNIINKIGGV